MRRCLLVILAALLVVGVAAGAPAKLRPNGRIVWVSNRDFSDREIRKAVALEIYSMNVNGSDVRRLTNDRHNDEYPTVSPDGGKIAFVDECCGYTIRSAHIVVMNANGSRAHSISGPHGSDTMPSWSPDGRLIAFSTASHTIWLMRRDGSGRREVTTAEGHHVQADLPVSWFPDGKTIAFEGVDPDDLEGTYGTWSIGIDARGAKLIAPNVGQSRVSPDGKKLVGVGRGAMVVVDLRSGARRRLTSGVIAAQPAWSPDARKIVYDSSYLPRTPYQEITTVNATGSGKRRLTSDARDDLEPVWASR